MGDFLWARYPCLDIKGCALCKLAVCWHSSQLLAVWSIYFCLGLVVIALSQLYATKSLLLGLDAASLSTMYAQLFAPLCCYTLHPTPYTLHPFPKSYTLNIQLSTLNPEPCTLNLKPQP